MTRFFALFLTMMAWSGPLAAACPSYMVLTCREARETSEKPENRPFWQRSTVEDASGRRIGTIERGPTGKTRIFARNGDLVADFRVLMPDYLRKD